MSNKEELKTGIIRELASEKLVVNNPKDYKVSQWEIDIFNAGIEAGKYIIELKLKNNEVLK
jgi:hypothetical protein